MDNEEAYLLLVALEETLNVVEEVKEGLQLPHLILDKKLLIRVPIVEKDYYFYESTYIELDQLMNIGPNVELELSELDVNRVSKIKKILHIKMKYLIYSVDM